MQLDREQHPKLGICRLGNLGNTCYMNAALQIIFNSRTLINLLIDRDKLTIKDKKETPIINYLSEMINEIYSKGNMEISPLNFKQKIGQVLKEYNNYYQHDSEEFLLKIIDKMSSESLVILNEKFPDKLVEINDIYTKLEKIYNDSKSEYDKNIVRQEFNDYLLVNFELYKEYKTFIHLNNIFKKGYSKIYRDVFTTLLNKNSCRECKKITIQIEHVSILQLPLPDGEEYLEGHPGKYYDMKYSLDECLENHFKEELLYDYQCPQCKKTNTTTRILRIVKSSPLLLIQIIRSVNIRGRIMHKRNNTLIPSNTLNMGIYHDRTEENLDSNYKLTGVINHIGGHNSGHYYSICRSPINQKWYNLNDSFVSYHGNEFQNMHSNEISVLMYEFM